MIRYTTNLAGLNRRINHISINGQPARWLARAATANAYFTANGRYSEPPNDPHAPEPFWSEIKSEYLHIQNRKCGYCESRPSRWHGDYYIDHYRPKKIVYAWPPATGRGHRFVYSFTTGGRAQSGYYRLAYHPLNYVACCHQCNERLKAKYFPIGGVRNTAGTNPVALKATELPYLIYPLGNHDDNPEDLIEFYGYTARPKNKYSDSFEHRRARVTIDLFELDEREDLREERSYIIEKLFDDLEDETGHADPRRRQRATNRIRRAQLPTSTHSSCAKCFIELYRSDYDRAKRVAELSAKYLHSKSSSSLPRPQ